VQLGLDRLELARRRLHRAAMARTRRARQPTARSPPRAPQPHRGCLAGLWRRTWLGACANDGKPAARRALSPMEARLSGGMLSP
jgi:hypothetical protein